MHWEHDPDCVYGHKVFQSAWSPAKYFIQTFYRCRWECEAQAMQRILEVGTKAIGCEAELALGFTPQAEVKRIAQRAQRREKGWMSFGLQDLQHKLWVGPPSLIQLTTTGPSLDIILQAAQLAISVGILRLTKAKLWAPDEATGHIALDVPAIESKTALKSALKSIGMTHGRIHPPRPIEVLEQQLNDALKIGEISPYLT